MESYSHPTSYGTWRSLPQTFLLLLRTCLAASPDRTVAQSHTGPSSIFECIKAFAYRLLINLNPFVRQGTWTSTTFVGMVKLTAICSIGSSLWIWSKRNRKSRVPSDSDRENAYASKATGECMIYPTFCSAARSRVSNFQGSQGCIT